MEQVDSFGGKLAPLDRNPWPWWKKSKLDANLMEIPFPFSEKMSAPLTHFFKHLSYTLLRRRSRLLLHPPYSPLTLFLTTSYKAKDPSPSSNTANAKLSSSSASCIPTKAEESFTYPSYLSVHIRCRKDVAVSFFSLSLSLPFISYQQTWY